MITEKEFINVFKDMANKRVLIKKDFAKGVFILSKNNLGITGAGKDIIYGPMLLDCLEIEKEDCFALFLCGWKVIDTEEGENGYKRAKLAFMF